MARRSKKAFRSPKLARRQARKRRSKISERRKKEFLWRGYTLDQLLEILGIGREVDTPPIPTAHAFYQASESFEIPWLRRRSFASAGDDQWEVRAAQVLSDDLSRAHRRITTGLLARRGGAEDESTDYLSLIKDSDLARFRDILEELRAEESVGLAAASVAARELSALADRVARNPRQEDRR